MHIACGSVHTALLTGRLSSLEEISIRNNATGKHTLYTFGKNTDFQLGHGDRGERQLPSLVVSVHDTQFWNNIACGANFTVGLDRRYNVWSWGSNESCQLGYNITSLPASPNRLAGKQLTINRGKGPARVINIPKDTRKCGQTPQKLVALKAASYTSLREETGTERMTSPISPSLAAVPDSQTILTSAANLRSVCRQLRGLYDASKAADICEQLHALKLASLVWLSNDKPAKALRLHARSLQYSNSPLDRDALLTVLNTYENVLYDASEDEQLNVVRVMLENLPVTSTQHLEGALLKKARQDERWLKVRLVNAFQKGYLFRSQLLIATIERYEDCCDRLSLDFRFDLMQIALERRQKENKEQYVAISEAAFDDAQSGGKH